MGYAIVALVVLLAIGLGLYGLLTRSEVVAQVTALQRALEQEQTDSAAAAAESQRLLAERDMRHANIIAVRDREIATRDRQSAEMIATKDRDRTLSEARHFEAIATLRARHAKECAGIKAEQADLAKFRHIPDIIAKSRRLEAEIAARLARAEGDAEALLAATTKKVEAALLVAQQEADATVLEAHKDVERRRERIAARESEARGRADDIRQAAEQEARVITRKARDEIADDRAKAGSTRHLAETEALAMVEAARKEAKGIASAARKEAKDKTQKVDEALERATAYALAIRTKAESRVREIAGAGYQALQQRDSLAAAAEAMRHIIEGYADNYLVPPEHILDELAHDFGFHRSGERLKLARERSRIMERNGTAATCNYPEGWKRDYAINFVLGAFNGKVDSILARLKPANQAKLIQEVRDTFALTNHNGEVFKDARIHEEYLDARLEELKWGVAVQRIKEKERDEQRAIREQIREEERAQKEYDRAVKQAQREEELINKAIGRARASFEAASAQDKERYEAELTGLTSALKEAEDKNRKAISMAQQTKQGHVYVISNVGSFGEEVYKIGLTRRLEPLDRVRELGDASVPFSFDVHALIRSDDAPALEAALHREFLPRQVNKVNRRKEFFRLNLREIRRVVDELCPDVRWTMTAEARDYRESLAMEQLLRDDPDFRRRWTDSESAHAVDDDFEDQEAVERDILKDDPELADVGTI